jgi:hypothetical protein
VDTSQVRDVPALRVPLPGIVRPWDTSRVAFVDLVRAEDGYVTFGFKEPGSPRVRDTGVRAAVSRATILAGLRLLSERGARDLRPLTHVGAVIVRMDPEAAADIRELPFIDYAEPRRWARVQGVPGTATSLQVFSAAMGQYSNEILPWGVNMVNAPEAWDSSAAGFGASVLIIDTGHEQGHEDLPPVPSFHCGGPFGGCDDGFPMPHGTHVTGILTARDNGLGVVGVAPGIGAASVYLYGACDSNFEEGPCNIQKVAEGVDWGIALMVDVINLSLGTPDPAEWSVDAATAVAAALSADIVVVAAAGNNLDSTPFWPAAQDGVIGVSGVQNNFEFASTSPCPVIQGTGLRPRSNWGPHVDLAAPFWALSTVPSSDYADETGTPTGSGFEPFWCGTSFATPHVSAAAAILRGKYRDMPQDRVAQYLFNSADDRGPAGWDEHFGYGIVDVFEAYALTLPASSPPTLSVSINGPEQVPPDQSCSYSSTVSGGTGSYSYQWSRNGVGVGTGSNVTVYTGDLSRYTLTLVVQDTGANWGSNGLSATVSSGAPDCLQR